MVSLPDRTLFRAGLSRRRLAAVLACILLAGPMAWLALPRLAAAFAMAPGEHVLSVLQDRKPVDPEGLRLLIESRERASERIASPRVRSDLALARLVLADSGALAPEQAASAVASAEEDLRTSVSLAPANPYAWARLAIAQARTGADPARRSAALAMSFLTGPNEPQLLGAHLALGLDLWPQLAEADRDLVRRRIRYAARHRPADLVAAADTPARLGIVRVTLAAEPRSLQRFDRQYKRLKAR